MDTLSVLLNLLEDEFRGCEGVRVRPVFPSGLKRSVDLEQDYDPESADLHRRIGVNVWAGKREYFFPLEWLTPSQRSQLDAQISQIREFLG